MPGHHHAHHRHHHGSMAAGWFSGLVVHIGSLGQNSSNVKLSFKA